MATKTVPAKKAPAKKMVAPKLLPKGVAKPPRRQSEEDDDRLPIVREGPKR